MHCCGYGILSKFKKLEAKNENQKKNYKAKTTKFKDFGSQS